MNKNEITKISKTLSYICRHGAIKSGLKVGKDGYIELNSILKLKLKNTTIEQVKEVVESNDKQRFKLIIKDNEVSKVAKQYPIEPL